MSSSLCYRVAPRAAANTIHLLPTLPLHRCTAALLLSSSHHRSVSSSPVPHNQKPLRLASRFTQPAWPHPIYTLEQMENISIAHREARTVSDKVALLLVTIARKGFDIATGYTHDSAVASGNKPASSAPQFAMTPKKWLIRFLFLESIAGVPGMVAGMVRHLHSLRRLKRDGSWIDSLLEEAYNERLHLLTFMKMKQPGWFMRLMLLGAQGVFFNAFFACYLLSAKTCHRFVGYLEEEAVITYSRCLADLDAGRLPEWENMKAPDIAIGYFNLKPDAMFRDVLLAIRADEAKHREVNHTFANLSQSSDPNPYCGVYEDPSLPHPTKTLEAHQPTGWERDEVINYAEEAVREDATKQQSRVVEAVNKARTTVATAA